MYQIGKTNSSGWDILSRKTTRYRADGRDAPTPKPKKQPEIRPSTTLPSGYACADAWLVPLNLIHTDQALFQNRAGAYSTESVQRITHAVKNDYFRWQVFDPVLLWQRDDAKLFILSGHSRFEAFTQLSKEGAKVDGRGFAEIPAKIIKVPQAEAVRIALMSNTLATPETATERAVYYRQLLNNGVPAKEVADAAKMYEGRNANFILNVAYLDPNGLAFDLLRRSQQKTDSENYRVAQQIANWVGEAARTIHILTSAHQTELFRFLADPKQSKNISNKGIFLNLIRKAVDRNTEFGVFDTERPLNLQSIHTKSYEQQQYEERLNEAKRGLETATKARDARRSEWIKRGEKSDDIENGLKKYNDVVVDKLMRLQQIQSEYGRVLEAEKQSLGLFGTPKTNHTAAAIITIAVLYGLYRFAR